MQQNVPAIVAVEAFDTRLQILLHMKPTEWMEALSVCGFALELIGPLSVLDDVAKRPLDCATPEEMAEQNSITLASLEYMYEDTVDSESLQQVASPP
jgi:hypothetical protein